MSVVVFALQQVLFVANSVRVGSHNNGACVILPEVVHKARQSFAVVQECDVFCSV